MKKNTKGRIVPSRYMDQINGPLKVTNKEVSEGLQKQLEEEAKRRICRSSSVSNISAEKPICKVVRRNTRVSTSSTEMSTKASTPVKNLSRNLSISSGLDLSAIPKTTSNTSATMSNKAPAEADDENVESSNIELLALMEYTRYLQSEFLLAKAKQDCKNKEKDTMNKILSLSNYLEELNDQKHTLELKHLENKHKQDVTTSIKTQETALAHCIEGLGDVQTPLTRSSTALHQCNSHFELQSVAMPTDKIEFTDELAEALEESNTCLSKVEDLPDDFFASIQSLSRNLRDIDVSTQSELENLSKSYHAMAKSMPQLLDEMIQNHFKL